jgi:beta-phosphoglucomutase
VIKAVIFDLDGTLVQTEALKARAYAEAVRRLGNTDTTDEQLLELYKEQIGQTREVVSRFLMERLGLEEQCRSRLEEYSADEPWQVLTRMRIEAYEEMIADPQVLRDQQWPHTVALLRSAHAAGCRTALATSSLTKEAHNVLAALDLEDQFEEVIGADQVSNPKPDPQIYLLAASRLGVPPQECLVVEDSPTGVSAGLAAGMNVIGVANEMTDLGLHNSSGLDHRWIVHEPSNLPQTVAQRIAEHNQTEHDGAGHGE